MSSYTTFEVPLTRKQYNTLDQDIRMLQALKLGDPPPNLEFSKVGGYLLATLHCTVAQANVFATSGRPYSERFGQHVTNDPGGGLVGYNPRTTLNVRLYQDGADAKRERQQAKEIFQACREARAWAKDAFGTGLRDTLTNVQRFLEYGGHEEDILPGGYIVVVHAEETDDEDFPGLVTVSVHYPDAGPEGELMTGRRLSTVRHIPVPERYWD